LRSCRPLRCAITRWRSRPRPPRGPTICRARWRRSARDSARRWPRGATASSPSGRASSACSPRPTARGRWPAATSPRRLTRAWTPCSAPGPGRGPAASGPLRRRAAGAVRRAYRALAGRVPRRDLLAGGEPHAAELPHVSHEVFHELDARGASADERMAGEDEGAVLRVHAREFLAPHLEDAAGIGDGVGGAVDVTE